MKSARTVLLVLGLIATPAPVFAQTAKLGRKDFTDEQNGYRFTYPHEWTVLPVQPNEVEAGVICRMEGAPESVKDEAGNRIQVRSTLAVLRLPDVTKHAVPKPGAADRTQSETLVRTDLADLLPNLFFNETDTPEKPDEDEVVKVKKLEAHHRLWRVSSGTFLTSVDTWTFPFPERKADIAIVFFVGRDSESKWLRIFEKSAKTFEPIDVVETSSDVGESYEDLLAYHEREAERTPGWHALPTPSKKFIIKTDSDNKKFIDEVIERLEASRELYEADFPPPADFHAVSVVRICANEQEFHFYGHTSGGVAGWFNPETTELVLYDAVDIDRNQSYAVMSHEGFHQYCYYLFGRAEAHRWFDEGHGDYYGGVKFGRKAEVTPHMPGGLDRYGVIKEMVRDGTYAPLRDHLNFDHHQWQTQGPTNVSCYAESWSIIYMLRQGALGKVSRRYWKPEYADILPHYVETLTKAYKELYAKQREDAIENAKAEHREARPEELEPNPDEVTVEQRNAIWKEAMDASWGKIDLDEFEQNWLGYVQKEL